MLQHSYQVRVTHECHVHEKSTRYMSVTKNYNGFFLYKELEQGVRDVFDLPPSAPFVVTYSDPDWEDITIATDVGLLEALNMLVAKGLRPLPWKVVGNCSSATLKVVHGDIYFCLAPPPGQLQFCYDEFHSRVRGLFKLPPSVQLVFRHKDPEFPRLHRVVTNDEDLKAVLEQKSQSHQQLDLTIIERDNETNIIALIVQNRSPYVVKISYNKICRRLAFAADEMEISNGQFQRKVLDLFELPFCLKLELSYKDEDGDFIIMSKGEELKIALVRQWLNPLRLELKIQGHDKDTKSPIFRDMAFGLKINHKGHYLSPYSSPR